MIGKEYDFAKVEGLFELSCKEPKIKDALQKYYEYIEMIDLCIFQPRSFGIHAAAVIIAPKYDKNGKRTKIWDYTPIRLADGQYVTEWEKETIENIGLLKEDILGLTQLDKFMRINDLISQSNNKVPTYEDVDFNDEKVFKLFKEGLTEDVFQFNTSGLKQYCIDLQPDDINDLVAANALYRPGAMESNSHNKYVKIKHGQEKSVLPKGLEEIMESTYGLYIYQEQAMLSYQKVTNCDLNEADNFRKVITKLKPGKKNPDIEKYEEIFKEAYMKMIDDKSVVDDTWNKIIAFATYGFNKCIHEDSSITVYRNNNSYTTREKIKTLYEKFEKGESIFVQSYIDGKLQPAKVKSVFYTGKKELYKIVLKRKTSKFKNGIEILSSKDHKFLTHSGWKRLEDLKANDEILTIYKNKLICETSIETRNKRSIILTKLNKTKKFRDKASSTMKKTMQSRIASGEASKHTKALHENGLIDTTNWLKSGQERIKELWATDYENMRTKSWEPWHKASVETGKKGSKLEKQLFNYLCEILPEGEWKRHQVRKIENSWRQFDIYSEKFNCFIEFDGKVHYDPIYGEEFLETVKKKDLLKNDFIINDEKSYMIRVLDYTGENTLKVANDIKKSILDKALIKNEVNYFYNCDGGWHSIESITKVDDGETYDIEIDNKEHNYVANGIIVHNSHAASYSVTGYIAQWYKCYYPLEFYTAALEFSTDDSKKTIIQEINVRRLVELKAPDVNKSTHNYTIDYTNNSIYWSFTSIKFVGDKAIEAIITEREKSNFKSFEDFIKRMQGTKVNKRVIENLIFSGAFDEIENIQNAKERLLIWKQYSGDTMPTDFTEKTISLEHAWILKQNNVSGFGEIPFDKIFKTTKLSSKMIHYSNSQMQELDKLVDKTIVVSGLLYEIKLMNTKRGQAARIQLNQNNDLINITMWNETWENYKSQLNDSENKNKIFFISGSVKLDRSGKKIIMTNNESKIELI